MPELGPLEWTFTEHFKRHPAKYSLLSLAFLTSLGLVTRASGDVARLLLSVPVLGSLFLGLFQILRDEAAHQKTLHLELKKEAHELRLQEAQERHDLRLAAIDRRLEAHQQAFVKWFGLITAIQGASESKDGSRLGEEVAACEKWWSENWLYLGKEVSQDFRLAYYGAFPYFNMAGDRAYSSQDILEEWQRLNRFPQTLARAIDLPDFGEITKRPSPEDHFPRKSPECCGSSRRAIRRNPLSIRKLWRSWRIRQ